MRRSGTVAFVAAMTLSLLSLGQTPAAAQYDGYAYPGGWAYGSPEYMDRIGEVLDAIDSPSRRSDLAENWLDFSKTAIAKNLELREDWVDLQRIQVRQSERADQLRLEMARLQMQIEQLRAENLRLERENLQLQMQLNGSAAPDRRNRTPAAEPDESAAEASTAEPAPQTPPAGRQ